MFEKVLVANRGEIALRVMRACADLGVNTVAIYSDADRESGHVRYADEAYNVGPAPARESYLNQERILDIANRANADAIHPGYGFLAENASFAAAVEASPQTWIGPSSEAMRRLGEKTTARQTMEGANVPIVPGTTEPVTSVEDVEVFGSRHGYPLAIKAVGGGGGKGMRVVHSSEEIEEQLEAAQREGAAYFDDPTVYIERFLESPKHIEVQILADEHGNVRHLGERDCSMQRRHQKVIEEAPSPAISASLREAIGDAARRGVAEAGYTNAGTVEFLVEDGEFYFLEVNTRIQVEHTITEMVTGYDLVSWQLRIAAGEAITFEQDSVSIDGHAIEYRINAENPATDFQPTPGTLQRYDVPKGIGVRVDDAIRAGDEVTGQYDSLIGKLIVFGPDRETTLARSHRAFEEFDVEGIHTTIPFHRLMLEDDRFRSGNYDTNYLDVDIEDDALARAVERWGPTTLEPTEETTDWEEMVIEVDGRRFSVSMPAVASIEQSATTQAPSQATEESTATSGNRQATSHELDTSDGEEVTAAMQGTILDVAVEEGDVVEPGDVVCVLEAMKMENDIASERGGTVARVAVSVGESVDLGDTLVVLE